VNEELNEECGSEGQVGDVRQAKSLSRFCLDQPNPENRQSIFELALNPGLWWSWMGRWGPSIKGGFSQKSRLPRDEPTKKDDGREYTEVDISMLPNKT
jgi:hypothetical protein